MDSMGKMALGILRWLAILGAIGKQARVGLCGNISLSCLCSGICGSSPIVSKVSPSQIGEGGGAVTIEGAGFSEDVFNQFDPVLGNKVNDGYFYAVFLLILLPIVKCLGLVCQRVRVCAVSEPDQLELPA